MKPSTWKRLHDAAVILFFMACLYTAIYLAGGAV